METITHMRTPRLSIRPLDSSDAAFVQTLVNTEGWIRFIGNRNISSAAEALRYIESVLCSPGTYCWVVSLRDQETRCGLVTFIRRSYLEHHDIGFAFLPEYCQQGYAYEATKEVIDNVIAALKPSRLLATTVPENSRSIRLLSRLGLAFENEIEIDNEKLHVYGAETSKLAGPAQQNLI